MTHGESKDCTVIRCWPADGDHVKFFPTKSTASGVATLSIAYNLGHDFHSCAKAERKERVLGLFRLIKIGVAEVADEIEREFKVRIQ